MKIFIYGLRNFAIFLRDINTQPLMYSDATAKLGSCTDAITNDEIAL